MRSSELLGIEVSQTLCTGEVKEILDGVYWCEWEGQLYSAKKSHDCLLMPQVGDTVVLFTTSTSIYILNVLERVKDQHHLYHFPGHTAFVMEEHFVQSCDQYRLQTRDYALQSDDLSLESKHFAMKTELAGVEAKTLTLKTSLFRRQAERVYNFVAQFEHQVFGRLRTIVKQGLRIEAEETRISSQGVTQIEGEQIHLG